MVSFSAPLYFSIIFSKVICDSGFSKLNAFLFSKNSLAAAVSPVKSIGVSTESFKS
jgi:hypothetical protein